MAILGRKTSTTPISKLASKADSLRGTAATKTQAAQDFVSAATEAANEARVATSQATAVDEAYEILINAGVTSL